MKTSEIYIEKIGCNVLFKIGCSAQENFDLIDSSNENDLWFHVQGKPSCHIVASIHDISKEIDRKKVLSIVKQGAVLCKKHSKYANEKDLPIVYTQIKNLEKTDVVGSVIVTNEKTIAI